MPYIVEDHFLAGIPQTALVGGLASRGISDHWTAGGIGRRGALDTAQFFIDRADRNASYHEIPWWEQGTRTFGVLRIVKAERAAHSMNPNPPTWAPNAEVRRILGDKVGDPNSVSYARSFAGMPADLGAAMKDPYFVECYVRHTRELLAQETTIKVERPLFNHGWGQPTTRTDAGDALIPTIYAGLYAQEDDMPQLTNYALEAITLDVNANVRAAPAGTAPILFRTTALSDAVRVGTVVNAEGTWSVFWQGSRKVWAYTVAQNVIKVAPLPVVKEADCTAVVAAATAPLTERIRRGKEAAVQIGEVAEALETVLG